jgi:hypothetical protein
MPTDHHFKLMDRILNIYCDLYNDYVQDGTFDIICYKERPIKKLNAGCIIESYFWDEDYDFPPQTAKSMSQPENKHIVDMMGLSDDAVSASLNLPVDSSDMALEKFEEDEDWKESDSSWPWFPDDPEEEV